MSIKNRNELKNEFLTGVPVTEQKFSDLFDSYYNVSEDSVLIGPIGQTGINGLIGPSGATHYNGTWYSIIGDTPETLTSLGSTGQITADESGIWICYEENKWVYVPVSQGSTGATGPADQNLIEITYSNLYNLCENGNLEIGTYYKITDFKTCYDQPNYDYNGSEILTGTYKAGETSSIIVFAIGTDTLASDAYQPQYPNDNIKYDISFNQTEVTGGTAFGRITYRKDNQGNAFDYDFREVLFKRYDAYVSDAVYEGTIVISASGSTSGIVEGTGTSFTNFSTGNIIGILKNDTEGDVVTYYQIISIEDDTNMVVTGNVIIEASNASLVNANRLEGMSWKQNNIVSNIDDYEYPTFENHASAFNNASINTTAYTQFREKIFFLPNNVFRNIDLEFPNIYTDNLFGTDFRNNTFNDDCDSNIVRDDFRNNIITNSFDHNTINNTFRDNVIECDFNSNTISGSFYKNHFGDADGGNFNFNTIDCSFFQNFYTAENDFMYNTIKANFYNNIILDRFSKNTINGFYYNIVEENFNNNQIGEQCYNNRIYSSFGQNVIGTDFTENAIYSSFYENEIGNYFRYNVIGDSGNTSNFDFRGNRIGHSSEYNTIRQDFENNQIGNSFNNNTANGDFRGNVIGHDFYQNGNIGYAFEGNHIGNSFNNNELIGDYFQNNLIGNDFYSNNISYNFKSNQIGSSFKNNTLGNSDYFNWTNISIENLDSRDYANFQEALYGNDETEQAVIGQVILGKELIMHDTVNNEFHKVKFTQWTQNGNGSGFSYERTKVWPTVESTVYFTKRNYEDIVDVIVEGSLEIARNNNGGAIYNIADENNWNSNVSPIGTLWNSIYTQDNNGSLFIDNTIAGTFKGNLILNEFLGNDVSSFIDSNEFLGSVYGNQIGASTYYNNFLGSVSGNKWKGNFGNNNIGLNFSNNTFGNHVHGNTLSDDFQNNEIGNAFNVNTIGDGFGFGNNDTQGNRIGNNFYDNAIGEYFYNNYISDNFHDNIIGNYFQWNVVNTNVDTIDFTPNYGNIVEFTYSAGGTSAAQGEYLDVSGITNDLGVNASFIINVTDGLVDNVTIDDDGKLYKTGDTIRILGTSIGGDTGVITTFSTDGIGLTGASGSYSNIFAQGSAGSGENAIFTVNVLNGVVDEVILTAGGGDYSVGNVLTILGSDFGGVSDISITVTSVYSDDVVITVTGVTIPSVYENYTCQIFKKQGGAKRLSFYDSNDILTIKNINE